MYSKLTRATPLGARVLLTCKSKSIPQQPSRCVRFGDGVMLEPKFKYTMYQSVRRLFGLIPPSQYDSPIPVKFRFMYVIREYWETIPLFVTTGIAVLCCIASIIWAINNKVDTVFSTHNRRNISRTMDLRNPTVHKIVIINQRYPPWPEMQDVLDKMAMAEKRALVRLQSCSHA